MLCEICNKKVALGKVSVAFNAENVVEPGTLTGLELSMQACEGCRPKAFAKLAGDVAASLESGILEHRELAENRHRAERRSQSEE